MESLLGRLKPRPLNSNNVESIPNEPFYPIPFLEDAHSENPTHRLAHTSNSQPCSIIFDAVMLDNGQAIVKNPVHKCILQQRGFYGYTERGRDENDCHRTSIDNPTKNYIDDSYQVSTENEEEPEVYSEDELFPNSGADQLNEEHAPPDLVLNHCEILFLAHCIGCLNVYRDHRDVTSGTNRLELLSLSEIWRCLAATWYKNAGAPDPITVEHAAAAGDSDRDLDNSGLKQIGSNELRLVEIYAAYIYYRAKGWIVKSGQTISGLEFLIYSESPQNRHAAYGVVVDSDRVSVKCGQMLTYVRVAHSIGKQTILCRVSLPEPRVIQEMHNEPWKLVKHCEVTETLIDFWKPNHKS